MKTYHRIRVSGADDAWRLHECVYQDEVLMLVQDWETLFSTQEDATAAGKEFAAHHALQAAPDETFVFDGDMPPELRYDHYWGTPLEHGAARIPEGGNGG